MRWLQKFSHKFGDRSGLVPEVVYLGVARRNSRSQKVLAASVRDGDAFSRFNLRLDS
jgi:hypothetical protein